MRTANELLLAAYERLQEYAGEADPHADMNDPLADEIAQFLTPPVKQIKNPYKEFYELPEDERIALIGTVLEELPKGRLYFPVGLAHGEFNYSSQQGLVFVNTISMDQSSGAWFRVGAFSPDDLDKDLDFNGQEVDLRDRVIAFLKQMHKHDVTYYGVLGAIQRHFHAGTITS